MNNNYLDENRFQYIRFVLGLIGHALQHNNAHPTGIPRLIVTPAVDSKGNSYDLLLCVTYNNNTGKYRIFPTILFIPSNEVYSCLVLDELYKGEHNYDLELEADEIRKVLDKHDLLDNFFNPN